MRVLALLLLVLAGCADAHPRDFRSYALRLEFERGLCSGTAVGKDIILSAEHCWSAGRLVAINDQPAYALKLIKDGKDHALVRVSMTFDSWAKVGYAPATGDRLRWIGQPAMQANVYREGYVSRAQTDEVWIDAQGFNGDSGAGLMDDKGRIVGVVSAIRWWRHPSGHSFGMIAAFPLAFSAEDWRSIR